MRSLAAILLTHFCASTLACAQPSAHSGDESVRGPVPVLKLAPGITAPVLLPVDISSVIAEKCERRLHGKVEIALIVDATGHAQNMFFLKPEGNYLDLLAIAVAKFDRFTPATKNGLPGAAGEVLDVKLEGCYVSVADAEGQKTLQPRLSSVPKQKLKPYEGYPEKVIFKQEWPSHPRLVDHGQTGEDGNVSSPIPITTPEAEFSEVGRRKSIEGKCVVGLSVDAYGLPRDMVVQHSLEPTMDQKALEAVSRYRFKPALRNGMEPIAVMITVEVNFRLRH